VKQHSLDEVEIFVTDRREFPWESVSERFFLYRPSFAEVVKHGICVLVCCFVHLGHFVVSC